MHLQDLGRWEWPKGDTLLLWVRDYEAPEKLWNKTHEAPVPADPRTRQGQIPGKLWSGLAQGASGSPDSWSRR
ncbi:Glucoside Xylosyltransferase 2 [Manis pentadactyla]|nr:Glucoside Xylosyltransferase 2 [Manis pentadactyla]